MPTNYILYPVNNLGTSPVAIRASVAASTQVLCLSLTMANVTAATVNGRAYVTRSGVDYDLVPLTAIPSGGSLVAIGESQKLVLNTGDVLNVVGDTATSLDCLLSALEVT